MNDILQDKMNETLVAFKANAECVRANCHRHLAFFDIRLLDGYRLCKLERYSREIALSLQTKTEPLITVIPELGVVRFKVALDNSKPLYLEDLFNRYPVPDGILPFIVGETDEGKPLWIDMASNPHMLVAGSTGSGKSNFLHVLIENALRRNDVDLFLVDPKHGVEFGVYENRAASISYNYDNALYMLDYINQFMAHRYNEIRKLGYSSVENNPAIFRKVLIIIDEVADLMIWDSDKNNPNKNRFEKTLTSIAQKARAAGIYIVLATQRPSVNVLTGLIKANFPARLSCKVSSSMDSKVILDRTGAETLLGRGDAIINNSDNHYERFQVAYTNPIKVK